MPRAKQEVKEEEIKQEDGKLPVEPTEVIKPEVPEEEPQTSNLVIGKECATVLNEQGTEIRTYSLEVHGNEYMNLARQYAKKVIDQENAKPRKN